MSTLQRENFKFVSDSLAPVKRGFPLVDGDLLDPQNQYAVCDGEWFIQSTSVDGKIERASDVTTPDDEPAVGRLAYPYWGNKGRTDSQAISKRQITLLWLGQYEFETRVFDATAVVGGGLAIGTIDQLVKVATVTIGSRNYVGLVGSQASDTNGCQVARVTRLATNNSGWLRCRIIPR